MTGLALYTGSVMGGKGPMAFKNPLHFHLMQFYNNPFRAEKAFGIGIVQ